MRLRSGTKLHRTAAEIAADADHAEETTRLLSDSGSETPFKTPTGRPRRKSIRSAAIAIEAAAEGAIEQRGPDPPLARTVHGNEHRDTKSKSSFNNMILASGAFILVLVLLRALWGGSSPAPSIVTTSEVNTDRELAVLAILRQQEHALHHWRTQQSLMLPAIVALEGRTEEILQRVQAISGAPAVAESIGSAICAEGDAQCTRSAAAADFKDIYAESMELSSRLRSLYEATGLHQSAPETGAAVPERPRVVVARPGGSGVDLPSYCAGTVEEAATGEDSSSGNNDLSAQLLCREERLLSRLNAVHSALSKLNSYVDDEITSTGSYTLNDGSFTIESHKATRYLDQLTIGETVEKAVHAEMAAQALYPVEVRAPVQVRRSEDKTLREKVTDTVKDTLRSLFKREWDAKEAALSENLSEAADRIASAPELSLDLDAPVAQQPQSASDSVTEESKVTEMVKEILVERKAQLQLDRERIIAQRKEEAKSKADEASSVAKSQPKVELGSDASPTGVEYSSVMRGGRVFTTPLVDQLVESASSLLGSVVPAVFGDPAKPVKNSLWHKNWLTTSPFSLTGIAIDNLQQLDHQRALWNDEFISSHVWGSAGWAKSVLRVAMGWDAELTGADPQVVLSHLTPSEFDTAIYADRISKENAAAPGSCYAFSGSRGNITILFKIPIRVRDVAIFHPPIEELPPSFPLFKSPVDNVSEDKTMIGGMHSAPKDFEVFGWTNFDNNKPISVDPIELGTWSFDAYKPSNLQNFKIPSVHSDLRFNAVTLSFRSNHGNPLFTCVYRIKIFGDASA
jgi:hypothetical protein